MPFHPNEILIHAFIEELQKAYFRTYGNLHSNYSEILGWAGGMALEIISGTDALYHNMEHTMHVTLVGQEILRGKHMKEGGVSPDDWLHFVISLLCHDIGYVKGVCRDDDIENNRYANGKGETLSLPFGATDAGLTKYHVDRGKLFVRERFAGHRVISADIIAENIELTRFPVPNDEDHKDTVGFPGMVRAADLIGQLSDPQYILKIPALYYEFFETGETAKLNYSSPGDLRDSYPRFFWKVVYPYVKAAIHHLSVTQTGKQYIANLYANVFRVENEVQMKSIARSPSRDVPKDPEQKPEPNLMQ